MKTVKLLALGLVAAFSFYSCGKDKDEAKEDNGKVYMVKSITCSDNENKEVYSKYTFTYDNNNRLVKVLKEKDDFVESGTYSYQTNTITEKWAYSDESVVKHLSRVITMNASNEFISNLIETHTYHYNDETEPREVNYPVSFSFNSGYLAKETEDLGEDKDEEIYTWANGNVSARYETSYSNIQNKTNMDFVLFYETVYSRGNLCFYRIFSQFIKNVSKNIPNSQSIDDGEYGTVKYEISTLLDEKGRPSKITVDEEECFFFEYYD